MALCKKKVRGEGRGGWKRNVTEEGGGKGAKAKGGG